MAGYTATPLSIKKYLKIPPRRLISGFLHINVINHSDNDDAGETGKFIDAYQYYRDKLVAGSMDSDQHNADPWRAQASGVFDDAGRGSKYLNFGDYDCLLFWVAGGMTLQTPLMGTLRNTSYLATHGFSDTSDNAWYTSIDDYCQNFVKYDLISRINNGYGHAALMGDEVYKGMVAITKNEFRADEAGISGHDCSVSAPDYTDTGGVSPNAHGGNFQKHIMSCGSFSTSGDGDEDLSDGDKNTYFPPVQSVEVYGTHRLNRVQQTGDASEVVYSINDASSGAFHHTDFWNLIIDIKMRGYDDGWTTGSPSQADKEWFKSRTNVFFQPFGETGNLKMSDTEHTS